MNYGTIFILVGLNFISIWIGWFYEI